MTNNFYLIYSEQQISYFFYKKISLIKKIDIFNPEPKKKKVKKDKVYFLNTWSFCLFGFVFSSGHWIRLRSSCRSFSLLQCKTLNLFFLHSTKLLVLFLCLSFLLKKNYFVFLVLFLSSLISVYSGHFFKPQNPHNLYIFVVALFFFG